MYTFNSMLGNVKVNAPSLCLEVRSSMTLSYPSSDFREPKR